MKTTQLLNYIKEGKPYEAPNSGTYTKDKTEQKK